MKIMLELASNKSPKMSLNTNPCESVVGVFARPARAPKEIAVGLSMV